ncbi:AI-2E family transporter [Azospira restricta]|uniref:AI-2E family transporter n=1 Tax=Azospira restricta TaxID=404405 RepID=A0A974Y4S4_9RHOO|nr:AI-2E family transporter [Azospira restricta]QRJ64785.1 AI-2E family transporter [Azospira restricta]
MQPRHTQYAQFAIVAALIVGCIAVLLPFVGTLLFAVVIAVTTWPLYTRLVLLFRQRHTLAALVMALLLVVLLAIPMSLLSGNLTGAIEMVTQYLRPLIENGLPAEPPAWLVRLPLIGGAIEEYWHTLAASREELNALLRQFVDPARKLALTAVKISAQGLLQLLLVIFFLFFIFRDAHIYGNALLTAARKLGGPLGERMLKLARGTITGVMVGIIGTAAAQALVGMVGYLIAGVPGVMMLTFATFIFAMVPVIGPTLIWGGAAFWLYGQGQTGWAVFMLLWGMLGISSVDNFIKPILISRTAAQPLLLIVVGVFGGVLVFGFIGIFLGPTLLALGQTLIREWIADKAADLNYSEPS